MSWRYHTTRELSPQLNQQLLALSAELHAMQTRIATLQEEMARVLQALGLPPEQEEG